MVVRKGRGERIEPTRLTFEQAATRWLDSKSRLRVKTRTRYEGALRNHLLPALGRKPIHAITEDDIARLIRELEAKGLKPWSIRGQALTPLSGIFKHAVRKGWRSDNPVRNLEADEKPAIESRTTRILEESEIHRPGRRPKRKPGRAPNAAGLPQTSSGGSTSPGSRRCRIGRPDGSSRAQAMACRHFPRRRSPHVQSRQ
jgi:integrase